MKGDVNMFEFWLNDKPFNGFVSVPEYWYSDLIPSCFWMNIVEGKLVHVFPHDFNSMYDLHELNATVEGDIEEALGENDSMYVDVDYYFDEILSHTEGGEKFGYPSVIVQSEGKLYNGPYVFSFKNFDMMPLEMDIYNGRIITESLRAYDQRSELFFIHFRWYLMIQMIQGNLEKLAGQVVDKEQLDNFFGETMFVAS